MSPRTGRPTVNPRTKTLQIRLTEDELNLIKNVAKHLGVTQTDAIMQGVKLLEKQKSNTH